MDPGLDVGSPLQIAPGRLEFWDRCIHKALIVISAVK